MNVVQSSYPAGEVRELETLGYTHRAFGGF